MNVCEPSSVSSSHRSWTYARLTSFDRRTKRVEDNQKKDLLYAVKRALAKHGYTYAYANSATVALYFTSACKQGI